MGWRIRVGCGTIGCLEEEEEVFNVMTHTDTLQLSRTFRLVVICNGRRPSNKMPIFTANQLLPCMSLHLRSSSQS